MRGADPHAALTAYLLGELDDERRREFEAHVAGCAACRADLAELAPTIEHGRDALPGPGAPPPGLVEATLGRVDPSRRSGSGLRLGGGSIPTRFLAGGAAAVVIVAVIAFALAGGGDGDDAADPLSGDSPQTGDSAPELRAELTGSAGSATIEIEEVASGRSIAIASDELPPLGEGGFYELWLVSDNDTARRPARVSAGTFRPSEDGVSEATMTVGVAPSRFDRIEITRERDRLPDAGGDTVLRLETKGLIQLG